VSGDLIQEGQVLRKHLLAAAIILSVGVVAFGQSSQPQMKGYELYSWKVGSKWHYSLLPGTNRAKTLEEITKNKEIKIGDAALKEKLKGLVKGEQVFWMSDAPSGVIVPPSNSSSMKLPSRKRIKSLMAYCDKLGIKLTLR
jgi:hypothetical protein